MIGASAGIEHLKRLNLVPDNFGDSGRVEEANLEMERVFGLNSKLNPLHINTRFDYDLPDSHEKKQMNSPGTCKNGACACGTQNKIKSGKFV